MRSILILLLLSFTANADIVFRYECSPFEGKYVLHQIESEEVVNEVIFEETRISDDVIEIIYDTNDLSKIQMIWGSKNEIYDLKKYTKDFYQWNFDIVDLDDLGFGYGDIILSIPNKKMVITSVDVSNDISQYILGKVGYSNCEEIVNNFYVYEELF